MDPIANFLMAILTSMMDTDMILMGKIHMIISSMNLRMKITFATMIKMSMCSNSMGSYSIKMYSTFVRMAFIIYTLKLF